MPGADAAEGQFPDAVETQIGGGVTPPPSPSAFYHPFTDLATDSSKYLNDTPETIVTMKAEETAGGLQWILSYVPTSAVVYAVSLLTTPTTPMGSMPATATSITTNGVTVNTISFDFPLPGPFQVGRYAFFAEVIVGGRTDVTSGIVVQVNPALGT